MKYSKIKELYLNSSIGENMPVSDEQKNIVKQLYEFEEKIKNYLPEADAEKIMLDYAYWQGELNSEIENTSFVEGFKTGLLIGAEVFSGSADEK